MALILLASRELLYGLLILLISIFAGKIHFFNQAPVFYLDVILCALVFCLLIRSLLRDHFICHLSSPGIVLLLVLFLIHGFVFLLGSKNFFWGLLAIRYIGSGLLVFLIFDQIVTHIDDIPKLIYFFVFWGILFSLIILVTSMSEGNLQGEGFQKGLYLTWGRSNYLATFLVALLPLVFALMDIRSYGLFWKATLTGIFILFLAALFLTGSRGGVLAAGFSLWILLVRLVRHKTRRLSILISVSIISAIALLSPAADYIFRGIGDMDKQITVVTRIINWTQSWKAFLSHPLGGVGFGNLGYYIRNIFEKETSAHNIVLSLLGETGIIGLVLYGAVLIHILRVQHRNCRLIRNDVHLQFAWGTFAGTLGILFHSLVEPSLWGYQMQVFFWLLVGISVKQSRWISQINSASRGSGP
ncbi:O-antigen ligase family protein [bacterium]|nr:O-antigen ligase family protein [bacterium]